MKMRKDVARVFLFIATIYWGIWLGGYIFNALMLVPLWSHNLPDSMLSYFGTPRFLAYFFNLVNPWVFLASLAAWLLTFKLDTGARYWLGWATLVAWIMLPLKIFMVITIGGVVRATMEGNFDPGMVNTVNWWKSLNWVTITTATAILILHLQALLNFNNPRQTKARMA
ncbi:MAG TPA: hypothetical protein VEY11_03580 [Pyrinomonadaceae bacterium]|nr:hypothetical protein [Pyrinomonadaceae bacterium]